MPVDEYDYYWLSKLRVKLIVTLFGGILRLILCYGRAFTISSPIVPEDMVAKENVEAE